MAERECDYICLRGLPPGVTEFEGAVVCLTHGSDHLTVRQSVVRADELFVHIGWKELLFTPTFAFAVHEETGEVAQVYDLVSDLPF